MNISRTKGKKKQPMCLKKKRKMPRKKKRIYQHMLWNEKERRCPLRVKRKNNPGDGRGRGRGDTDEEDEDKEKKTIKVMEGEEGKKTWRTRKIKQPK